LTLTLHVRKSSRAQIRRQRAPRRRRRAYAMR
jgi:hypothetical protein